MLLYHLGQLSVGLITMKFTAILITFVLPVYSSLKPDDPCNAAYADFMASYNTHKDMGGSTITTIGKWAESVHKAVNSKANDGCRDTACSAFFNDIKEKMEAYVKSQQMDSMKEMWTDALGKFREGQFCNAGCSSPYVIPGTTCANGDH